MPRSLDLSDFRGVRVVLEPSDFALGDDIPEPPPSDLIDKGTWLSLMTLPDDVAIRTSSYHGTAVKKMHDTWGALVEAVATDNQDALDAALLDAADDFQGAVFNAFCGFYRLSFTSLRSVVELISIGTDALISGNVSNFEQWRAGQLTITFDAACSGINRSSRLKALRGHLRANSRTASSTQRNRLEMVAGRDGYILRSVTTPILVLDIRTQTHGKAMVRSMFRRPLSKRLECISK